MKKWKRIVSVLLSCAMITGSFSVCAQAGETDEEKPAQAAGESELYGQLTLEDIDMINGGAQKVYSHDGIVTFVDGTCTPFPVTDVDDATAVVDSMIKLIGGGAGTHFIPWREVTDPLGNTYYIFQQMYQGTTVCGGAVKVITDADGNMIGLSSSVESEMPEVEKEESISAEKAQQIVVDRELENSGNTLVVLDQYTSKVILPSVLKIDFEEEDISSRFVWVVYTENPLSSVGNSSDLPYLAHYISMSGEYLYSMPAIAPDDEAGRSGYDSSYIFEFMEPVEYTGYVDLSDGTEKEITVTVMRDRRTGMYYLGNLERRIVVANCYDFLYDDGRVVLEASPDNLEWDQVGLLSLYNYCRAWDYYNEIGWTGGDGEGTPIIILNNFCDDHYNEVNNACYVGKVNGMQAFLASKINDFSQCLDILAHEFTHCVTGSLMTYNSYMNDYGAINEGMSDVQGKNCEMMAGDVDPDNWILGTNSATPVRSMNDPRLFTQPEYTWDEYYIANAREPSPSNDYGGVHFNSSLMNQISYMLVHDGGMSLDEVRTFWFMTDCTMVPGTDYVQLAELLPWVLKTAGMEQYAETLDNAIKKTRLADKEMPETMDEDHAMIRLSLPDTEAFDAGNWILMMTTVRLSEMFGRGSELISRIADRDFSFLPDSVQQVIEDWKKTKEESKDKDWKKELLNALATALSEVTGEDGESAVSDSEGKDKNELDPRIERDMMKWLIEELQSVVFSSYGFAGQDGSTLNMVVRPGRCIPTLQHMTLREGSDEVDQVAVAIYVQGKWYDLGVAQMMEQKDNDESGIGGFTLPELPMEILTDVLGKNLENLDILELIKNPESLLDLFTVEIKGGEILELSSEGLDAVVIPDPTPEAEKTYGKIEPGKKSRPKLTEETTAEAEQEEDTTEQEGETTEQAA